MDFGSFYLFIREYICKNGFHIHVIQVKRKLGTKMCIFGSRGSGHVAPRGSKWVLYFGHVAAFCMLIK